MQEYPPPSPPHTPALTGKTAAVVPLAIITDAPRTWNKKFNSVLLNTVQGNVIYANILCLHLSENVMNMEQSSGSDIWWSGPRVWSQR